MEESLHHHPEGCSEEEVDREWEEFTRLMAKLKENRRNRPHRYYISEMFPTERTTGRKEHLDVKQYL